MRLKAAITLVAASLGLVSCTPAFSVRLFNRSDRDIAIAWKSADVVTVPHGKDKIVGSANEYGSARPVIVKAADADAKYEVTGILKLPDQASRPGRFPAVAGSREWCFEYAVDGKIYVLNARKLTRLQPQPSGFPLVGVEVKSEPNQSPQHNAGSRSFSGDSSASGTPSSLGPRLI